MTLPLLHIRFRFGLGDSVLLTGLVRDIHRAYPGRFRVFADTAYMGLWQHNPRVVTPEKGERRQVVVLKYGVKQPTKIHFMRHIYDRFEQAAKLTVPLTEPKGEIFLDEFERVRVTLDRYWVVVAGGKLDMTTKFWPLSRWQEVVDQLTARGIVCVQAGALHAKHVHQPLKNVVNLLGKTDERQLAALIANAEGVVCGITAAMHLAACFDKPCVVVAGGREEPWWEHYANRYPGAFGPTAEPVKTEHVFLHTVGELSCCQDAGCWKPRTVPLAKNDMPAIGSDRLCVFPEKDDQNRPVPRCMQMITPDEVVFGVTSYYEKGWLPPIPPSDDKIKQFDKLAEMVKAGYMTGFRPEAANVLLNKRQVEELYKWGTDPAQPGADRTVRSLCERSQDDRTVRLSQYALERPDAQGRVGVTDDPIFDHPVVGGKFTVFVLCYGNYPELARRCLDNILRTTPAGRVELRVLCNAVGQETLDYVRTLPYVSTLYTDTRNILKYPAMRRAFHDPHVPIRTNYLIWFDDDSYPCAPDWLNKLADQIVMRHPAGDRLYGWEHAHDLKSFARPGHNPAAWFTEAPWYRGEQFQVRKGLKAANGSLVPFVAGGFWALHTETMLQAQIPDARLTHHGGDIVIGAQVAQAGGGICNFNVGKKYVFSSGHEPRGASVDPKSGRKPYPWKG